VDFSSVIDGHVAPCNLSSAEGQVFQEMKRLPMIPSISQEKSLKTLKSAQVKY
jgi:hypothetical protein